MTQPGPVGSGGDDEIVTSDGNDPDGLPAVVAFHGQMAPQVTFQASGAASPVFYGVWRLSRALKRLFSLNDRNAN